MQEEDGRECHGDHRHGGDVDSLGRFIEQDQPGVLLDNATKERFLLIATGKRLNRVFQLRGSESASGFDARNLPPRVG